MDLLLLQLPGARSFSSTHLAKVLSKRVKATLLSCNECESQEKGDRLSASMTLKDPSLLPFFFFYAGGSFICLLAFLLWEVSF